jgi:hypothetical protein
MEQETIRHLKDIIHGVATWWHAISIVFVGMVTMLLYWLRSSFVTKTVLDEHASQNLQQHENIESKLDEVKEDVAYIKGKISILSHMNESDG